jgi:hypothetical protein
LHSPTETSYKGIPVYRFPFALAQNDIDKVVEIRQQLVKLKQTFAPDLIHINAVGLSEFFHLMTANAYPAPGHVRQRGVRHARLILVGGVFTADRRD